MNASPTPKPAWIDRYEALVGGAAAVELGERTQIELAGADRASFLHNLCTNEIRKLPVGAGCEAFLTNVQGKTLAHVLVFACPETLVLDTVGGQGETILQHLDHYLVTEQVTLTDRSRDWSELLLAGPGAEPLLGRLCAAKLPSAPLSHAEAEIAGCRVWSRRVEMTAHGGYLINARREDLADVLRALVEAGVVECPPEAFEAARIEHGFPLFGKDISAANLPQEVGRDSRAISFVKGCYLGQETVARIDALGHVNKMLAGVRFAGSTVPEAGAELRDGDKTVGQVTSAAYSPRFAAAIALAYVRAPSHAPGTRLTSALGDAEVVALPMG
jgi:folate-binding protein YgfZ